MHARRHSFSRGATAALLGGGVLVLHLALLQRLWPVPPEPGGPVPAALQVRTLAMPPPLAPQTPPAPAARPAAPRHARQWRGCGRSGTRGTGQRRRRALAGVCHAPAGGGRAALPCPARRQHRPRAAAVAAGDGAYLLRLDTDWPGQAPRGTASRGLIDGEGVSPVRHTELQRARETRAVNFQREAGLITFSGPQLAYALRPGAQDRLSWWIQLPAIVEGDAALARPGASVQIFVVGARGDAEAWRFEVQGHEPLELPAGSVAQALHLRREPTRPYDSRVEVWLDPARQHLPVRAVFTTLPGGVPMEMALSGSGLESGGASPR